MEDWASHSVLPRLSSLELEVWTFWIVIKASYILQDSKCHSPHDPPLSGAAVSEISKVLGAKPGCCPFVGILCSIPNRPDRCKQDDDCSGVLKCCSGQCGNICSLPGETCNSSKHFSIFIILHKKNPIKREKMRKKKSTATNKKPA
ncbi:uncharacterized protein ACOB8E_010436 isoform 1-T1 [Sarcophilus harrisii]